MKSVQWSNLTKVFKNVHDCKLEAFEVRWYKIGVCKDCDSEKTEIISKSEHDYVWQVSEVATCFSEGSLKGICSVCSNETFKTLNKISHEYIGNVCSMCFNKNVVAILGEYETLGYTYYDIGSKIYNHGYSFSISDIESEIIKLSYKNDTIQMGYTVEGLSFNFAVENMFLDYVVDAHDDNVIEGLILNEFK